MAPVASAGSPAASMAPGASAIATVPVTLADFTVTPGDIQVQGTTVSFGVVNDGPTPHNLTIRDDAGTVLGATPDLSQGEHATLTLTLPAAGTYITFCSLPGHESLGLKGTLVVTTGAVGSSPPAPVGSATP
jgi:plastocyanin